MSQTSYSINTTNAFPGQLADINPRTILSYGAGVAIPFGLGLVQGSKSSLCALPGADSVAANFIGISLFEQTVENDLNSGAAQYPLGKAVNVVTKGRVNVLVEEAVGPSDPVYLRIASGAGGTQVGSFRKSADTATAILLTNCRWTDSIAAGAVGVLSVNLV